MRTVVRTMNDAILAIIMYDECLCEHIKSIARREEKLFCDMLMEYGLHSKHVRE